MAPSLPSMVLTEELHGCSGAFSRSRQSLLSRMVRSPTRLLFTASSVTLRYPTIFPTEYTPHDTHRVFETDFFDCCTRGLPLAFSKPTPCLPAFGRGQAHLYVTRPHAYFVFRGPARCQANLVYICRATSPGVWTGYHRISEVHEPQGGE